MFSRRQQYEADDQTDVSEDVSMHLSTDLRAHVHSLAAYPVFSPQWIEMTESLQHISAISMMEDRLPETAERGKTTLWERDELSVRFLLEEGKLNLSVRNMVEFKEFQNNYRREKSLSQTAEQSKMSERVFTDHCDAFERALGQLLQVAFLSIECLQTTDLPVVISHCSRVLEAAQSISDLMPSVTSSSQEILTLDYLGTITCHLEELNEDRVVGGASGLSVIEETNVVELVTLHVRKFSEFIPEASLCAACKFLCNLSESENFLTEKLLFDSISPVQLKFLKTEESQRALVWFMLHKVATTFAAPVKRQYNAASDLARFFKRKLKIRDVANC